MFTTMTRPGALCALALMAVLLLSAGACDCQKCGTKVDVSAEDTTNQAKPTPSADDDTAANAALAQDSWGTVKGTVKYDPDSKLPENPAVQVTADKEECIQGKIFRNEWVVDSKSRGVANVIVWLSDAKEFKKADWKAPIHPDLKKAPEKLVVDQPVCTFTPRVITLREETKLVFKNSSTKIGHNVRLEGGDVLGPNINQLIPPGKELELKDPVKARFIPFSYSCTIHPWMKGWIASFKHPYFAVTNDKGEFEIKNAPAGTYRLQVWHEGYGFVQKNKDDRGITITIKGGDTTEVKVPPLKAE